MAKVRWLHVINGTRVLLTFDGDRTIAVDVSALLGNEAFERSFQDHDQFTCMAISARGGIVWESGLELSGDELLAAALAQSSGNVGRT